jgi:hypothetical protein
MGPPALFTIPVLRYMKIYGLTHELLATVSVVQREWAAKNPRVIPRAAGPGGHGHADHGRGCGRARPRLPAKGTGESVEIPLVASPVIPAKSGNLGP